jgi:hypothetical protein
VRKLLICVLICHSIFIWAWAQGTESLPKAFLDGMGPGWNELKEEDFANVNCGRDTWSWKMGTLYCTGQPIGVLKTVKQYDNFEFVAQWRHLQSGGNSGIFVWASEAALAGLKSGVLPPGGIEVQILDHGFRNQYE